MVTTNDITTNDSCYDFLLGCYLLRICTWNNWHSAGMPGSSRISMCGDNLSSIVCATNVAWTNSVVCPSGNIRNEPCDYNDYKLVQ